MSAVCLYQPARLFFCLSQETSLHSLLGCVRFPRPICLIPPLSRSLSLCRSPSMTCIHSICIQVRMCIRRCVSQELEACSKNSWWIICPASPGREKEDRLQERISSTVLLLLLLPFLSSSPGGTSDVLLFIDVLRLRLVSYQTSRAALAPFAIVQGRRPKESRFRENCLLLFISTSSCLHDLRLSSSTLSTLAIDMARTQRTEARQSSGRLAARLLLAESPTSVKIFNS